MINLFQILIGSKGTLTPSSSKVDQTLDGRNPDYKTLS